jgi:HEAT repeat protein
MLVLAASLLCVACQGDPDAPSVRAVTLDLSADIAALGSDDLFESEPALDRIVAIGGACVPVLAGALETEPPAVRAGIVQALKKIGGREATTVLLSAARDTDTGVRYDALLALGDIDDPRGREPIEAALDDAEPQVRLAAAAACARLCSSDRALGQLVDMSIRDEPFTIGIAARASLVRMLAGEDRTRGQRARDAVRAGAATAIDGEGDLTQRTRAALLVADIGDQRAAPVLVEALGGLDSVHLRTRAAYALGDVGGTEAVPAIVEVLESGGLAFYGYDALRRMAERKVAGAQEALDTYAGPRPRGPVAPP